MNLTSNSKVFFDRLVSHGYSPVAAAGIVGRLQVESGPTINTVAQGDFDDARNPTAFGAAQWRGDRFAGLQRFAGERNSTWHDPLTQADYIHHELSGPEKRAGDMIRNAKTIEEAARGAMAYERPKGFTWDDPSAGLGFQGTMSNANSIYGKFGSGAPLSATLAAAPPLTPPTNTENSSAPNSATKPPAASPAAVDPTKQAAADMFVKGMQGQANAPPLDPNALTIDQPRREDDSARFTNARMLMASLMSRRPGMTL